MTISLGRVASSETGAWPRLPLTFATLMTALRSNNLAAARQAYGDLQTALQPHVGSLIVPVGTALGQGETAQAGKILGQLRGVIAAAAATPAPVFGATQTAAGTATAIGTATATGTGTGTATTELVRPAASTASTAFDWLV